LGTEGFFKNVTELARLYTNDTLDINDYPDSIEIMTKIINDFNARKKINHFQDFQDEGITLHLFTEAQYMIYNAINEERYLYKKYFYEIAKFLFRLGFFNILSISMYKKSLEEEIVRFLLVNISDPERGKEVKNLRSFGLRKYTGSHPRTLTLLLEKLRSTSILRHRDFSDYDDILHEDYLINWKKDDRDIDECLVKSVGRTPEQYRYYLRKFLRSIYLTAEIFPDEIDKMSWISNSTSYNYLKTFKSYLRSSKIKVEECLGQAFRFERCLIYVSPENCRDAWKGDVETTLQLKFYDHIIKNITKHHPKSGMCGNYDFDKRLNRIINHEGNYGMIDIKKSGLTVPHYLIQATLEELTIYLDYPIINWYNSIKRTSVKDGDKIINPKRGVGLGMANTLITLMNCIIMDVLDIDGIIYNDDIVVCLEDYDQLQSLEKFYDDVIDWPIKKEKSIFSKSFIFLEEYYLFEPEWYEKEQRLYMPFADFIFSENIWEVKQKFVNYKRACSNINEEFFVMMYNLYSVLCGSEFDRQYNSMSLERILPLEFGGWELYPYQGLNPILSIYRSQCDSGRKIISSILTKYNKFNLPIRVRYKEEIENIYPRRWKIESSNEDARRIIDELGFDQFYDQVKENLNSVEISDVKSHRIKKLKGIKTQERYRIWNNPGPISYSSSYLLVEEVLRSNQIPRLFTLENFMIRKITRMKSRNIPGHINKTSGYSTRPFERALAMLKFLDLEFKTNYPLNVTPEYIRMRDMIQIDGYSFDGYIPEKTNYSVDVLREVSKISLYPEITLAEYCYRNRCFVTAIKLKINDKYIIDDVEIPMRIIGSGKYEVELTPFIIRVTEQTFNDWTYLREKVPGIYKFVRSYLTDDKNIQQYFQRIVARIATTVKERIAELSIELDQLEETLGRYHISHLSAEENPEFNELIEELFEEDEDDLDLY
jgi:hypothetical protein